MKKIITLVLCLSFVLSSFSFSFVYAVNYEKASNFAEMEGLLRTLEVIDKSYEVSDAGISRAEFTKLIVKATGLGGYVSDNVTYSSFSDVEASNEYAPYLEFAKNKKLAFGYSDGSFKPEESVSLTEAIVYLIRLLGYTDIAEAKGGYPGGYQTLAYSIDLLTGVKIKLDDYLTKESAVHLLFNALNANVLMVDSFTSDSYTISDGYPLMYQSFKVLKVQGVVEGVDLTSLVGPNNVKAYNIMVNGTLIDVGNLKPNEFLGYNVNAYYEEDEDINILKFITANNKNKEEIMDISAVTDIINYTVYKTDSYNKQKVYSYKRGASLIFNGASTSTPFNMSVFNDANGDKMQGNVKLLDNNSDGVFEVIFVNAFEEYIVGKVDVSTKTIYDFNKSSRNIVLDTTIDDPYTVIYNEDGEEINIGKIKSGASVAVYKSKEKPDTYQEYIRAYVSEKTVTGVLLSKGYDINDNCVAMIDGKEFKMSKYAEKYFEDKLLGARVKANINYSGEISFIAADNGSSDKWGMLTIVGVPKNQDDPNQTYVARILTETGDFADYTFAKYITLDGRSTRIKSDSKAAMEDNADSLIKTLMAAAETVSAYTDAGSSARQLHQMIKYRLNDENKINYIDTVLKGDRTKTTRFNIEPSDCVYFEPFANETTYTNGGIHIGSKYYATSATRVFMYHETNKDECGVVPGTTAYQSYVKANGIAFYSDTKSVFPDVYMKKNDKDTSYNNMYDNYYAIVKKITDVVDDEGMPAKKIYAYVNNALVTFICSGDLTPGEDPSYTDANGVVNTLTSFKVSDLKEGDIICYSCDTITDELSNYDLIYRDGILYNPGKVDQDSHMAYVYDVYNDGFMYVICDKFGDIEDTVKLDFEKNNGDPKTPTPSERKWSSARLTTSSLTVYEPQAADVERIRAGSLSDLYSYREFKEEDERLIFGNSGSESGIKTSKILIHVYNNGYRRPVDIFILK